MRDKLLGPTPRAERANARVGLYTPNDLRRWLLSLFTPNDLRRWLLVSMGYWVVLAKPVQQCLEFKRFEVRLQ